MAADLSKRVVVRVTDAQDEWLTQAAADEGLDKATFLRAMVDRLSKGRAPLISMMEAPQPAAMTGRHPLNSDMRQAMADADVFGVADNPAADLLAERAALAESQILDTADQASEAPESEVVAMPLRRVQRERYNPGRN